jgi:hypothetical protein
MEVDETLDNLAQNIRHVHFADLILLNVRFPKQKQVLETKLRESETTKNEEVVGGWGVQYVANYVEDVGERAHVARLHHDLDTYTHVEESFQIRSCT